MGGLPENAVLHPPHGVQFATHAKLKVDDYYHNGARRRLRLHEKGGKEHEMPVHHLLEQILDEYTLSPQASRADNPCSRALIQLERR
jgi:hypothetical protein